ncbi:segregation and condensation protein B [Cnuella takakiae]|uniref:Segregation and condensation protein B n=1 Tax=Cnuella takakiae TaxID=1302690 RepID=A0A1M5AUZ2_9BACT|nr:SMC-Scp complex subunit ScpB [Cnuella takakiae]OLY93236.1 SMC-Scp complex subunit ScpB [Cnuella takakiae]SHF34088.1 segregation and condensation protein B [Cnuella takakiae]
MELSELIPHIEALIFASDKPLTSAEITELINSAFGFMENKVTVEQIETALEGIVEKYDSEFYPFTIRQSGGGWQFLTKKEYHKTVAQLNGEKFLKKLSAAALETLAIIAYKQPITKGEVEQIRGVSADYAIQKLLEKELIIIAGRNELAPGHPLVYTTSKSFMDYFGLNSPADLPKIREVLQENIVQPTLVNNTEFEPSEELVVSEDGELVDRTEVEGNEDGARLFVDGVEPDAGGGTSDIAEEARIDLADAADGTSGAIPASTNDAAEAARAGADDTAEWERKPDEDDSTTSADDTGAEEQPS